MNAAWKRVSTDPVYMTIKITTKDKGKGGKQNDRMRTNKDR